MNYLLVIMIGSWVSPDRIEFDTLAECEIAAEKLTYGKIITACELGELNDGISEPSDSTGGVL
tara:strand:+ start:257 stop:445 length:189 start_codon:yes stop_codon:yes gene_type:complete